MLIDAHSHLHDSRFEGNQSDLIAKMKNSRISHSIVNGTETADWPAVAQLAKDYPRFVWPSFGLHPWKVQNRAKDWEARLREFLLRFPKSGVGECGLDRWIRDHNIEDQQTVFRIQLQLATEMNRPCTIHCLKAWGPLLEVLNAETQLPRILLHSFGGSIETANEMAELGAWFSFSGYFLHPRKSKVVDVFRQLPKDRILVETDAPDMLPPETDRPYSDRESINHPANLAHISSRLCKLVGV
ncbi:MAG: TatD family hydrolase [Planctomycetota bacterium]